MIGIIAYNVDDAREYARENLLGVERVDWVPLTTSVAGRGRRLTGYYITPLAYRRPAFPDILAAVVPTVVRS